MLNHVRAPVRSLAKPGWVGLSDLSIQSHYNILTDFQKNNLTLTTEIMVKLKVQNQRLYQIQLNILIPKRIYIRDKMTYVKLFSCRFILSTFQFMLISPF